ARLKHVLPPSGPATWQDVETIALYFHEKMNRPSLPPLPESADEMDRLFHAVAAPFATRGVSEELLNGVSQEERRVLLYNYHFDIDSGAALIDGPGFAEALSLLQRLKKCRVPARSPRPAEALVNESVVAGLISLADLPVLIQFERATKGVRFGISAVPGSDLCYVGRKPMPAIGGNFVPYMGSGGWMAAMTPSAPTADAAPELLA